MPFRLVPRVAHGKLSFDFGRGCRGPIRGRLACPDQRCPGTNPLKAPPNEFGPLGAIFDVLKDADRPPALV